MPLGELSVHPVCGPLNGHGKQLWLWASSYGYPQCFRLDNDGEDRQDYPEEQMKDIGQFRGGGIRGVLLFHLAICC